MLDVQGLTYAYRGRPNRRSSRSASRSPAARSSAFWAPNGAGKSTTQKLLIRLLDDYQGRVSVFGRDLREWGNDYYERVGVSFEFPNHHLKLTARENLAFFRSLYAGESLIIVGSGIATMGLVESEGFMAGLGVMLIVSGAFLIRGQS